MRGLAFLTRPAPLLGEHSAAILRELGYGDERIETRARAGIVLVAADGLAARKSKTAT